MRFATLGYLLLLILVPLLIFYFRRMRNSSSVKYSDVGNFKKIKKKGLVKFRNILWIMRISALTLLILAAARPQYGRKDITFPTDVVDIMLAVDVSQSMSVQDFKPNRLGAAKKAAEEFIDGRPYDRIGLVVYATTAFTLCPLTVDHGVVKDFLSNVDFGIVDGNNTAIGTGLSTAIKRMKDSDAKSKFIILLTDGQNNFGKIDPITSANIAKTFNIKVYTIGVGSEGTVMVPQNVPLFGTRFVPMQYGLDEDTLKKIANTTGGKYYKAEDEKKLEEIYKEIDKEEKTEIKIEEHYDYNELMGYFALPALFLIIGELILGNTRLRKLP